MKRAAAAIVCLTGVSGVGARIRHDLGARHEAFDRRPDDVKVVLDVRERRQ